MVFSAQDKQSGIDHYEIQENRKQEIKNQEWIVGESPYLLADQSLKSYVYIKAVDKSGNERIVMLSPQKTLPRYENYLIFCVMILVLMSIYFLNRKFWRNKKITLKDE